MQSRVIGQRDAITTERTITMQIIIERTVVVARLFPLLAMDGARMKGIEPYLLRFLRVVATIIGWLFSRKGSGAIAACWPIIGSIPVLRTGMVHQYESFLRNSSLEHAVGLIDEPGVTPASTTHGRSLFAMKHSLYFQSTTEMGRTIDATN